MSVFEDVIRLALSVSKWSSDTFLLHDPAHSVIFTPDPKVGKICGTVFVIHGDQFGEGTAMDVFRVVRTILTTVPVHVVCVSMSSSDSKHPLKHPQGSWRIRDTFERLNHIPKPLGFVGISSGFWIGMHSRAYVPFEFGLGIAPVLDLLSERRRCDEHIWKAQLRYFEDEYTMRFAMREFRLYRDLIMPIGLIIGYEDVTTFDWIDKLEHLTSNQDKIYTYRMTGTHEELCLHSKRHETYLAGMLNSLMDCDS